MVRRSPIPMALRIVVGLLILRWVLVGHHRGRGAAHWEQAHRHWHGHFHGSRFGREPGSLEPETGVTPKEV